MPWEQNLPGAGINGTSNNPLSSLHHGGFNALAADGSVHFIDNNINLVLLKQLATRDDGSGAKF